MINLQLGPSHLTHFDNLCDTIKQKRVFVELILQPEMNVLENRPRPKTINTERDESSHTHLTVFTTLRSFRDAKF